MSILGWWLLPATFSVFSIWIVYGGWRTANDTRAGFLSGYLNIMLFRLIIPIVVFVNAIAWVFWLLLH